MVLVTFSLLKMGTYVENLNIKLDWSQYAEHGFDRMQQRGMTQEMVDKIVANGKTLSQNNGSKFVFITQEGNHCIKQTLIEHGRK